jgi:hypothetical protein
LPSASSSLFGGWETIEFFPNEQIGGLTNAKNTPKEISIYSENARDFKMKINIQPPLLWASV